MSGRRPRNAKDANANARRPDIPPEYWGKPAWAFITATINGYPANKPTKKESTDMLAFLKSLHGVIPCSSCRKSFHSYAARNPLSKDILSTRENIHTWIEGYKTNLKQEKQSLTKHAE
jgi:hypothetical protein